jgi:hypothetical protein
MAELHHLNWTIYHYSERSLPKGKNPFSNTLRRVTDDTPPTGSARRSHPKRTSFSDKRLIVRRFWQGTEALLRRAGDEQ